MSLFKSIIILINVTLSIPGSFIQANRIETMNSNIVAEEIWDILHDEYEFNDYICAGIMGNIMVEVGGTTLNINPYLETSNYYGICQWSKEYFPTVRGADLRAQCQFLFDTIEIEFETFGSLYVNNFDYADFLLLNNEREAALAFAMCYERSSPRGWPRRQDCATKAYQYFVKSEEKVAKTSVKQAKKIAQLFFRRNYEDLQIFI